MILDGVAFSEAVIGFKNIKYLKIKNGEKLIFTGDELL
jgi:hypothetical protein